MGFVELSMAPEGAEGGVDWETVATAHSRETGSHELEPRARVRMISIVRQVR